VVSGGLVPPTIAGAVAAAAVMSGTPAPAARAAPRCAATAVRESAAAIGALLGLLYLFPIIAAVVSDPHWQRHLEQIGPTSAGLAIQATTGLCSLPLSPWAGFGVLAAGGLLLRLRDALGCAGLAIWLLRRRAA
jgi:ABC-2 type transport system permease protein